MAVERALLLLADIGGYTEFTRLHRLSLAHSQEITHRLLEGMVDAVRSLSLVEVEGDAVFLYGPDRGRADGASDQWLSLVLEMHRAFHERQQWMQAHNLCSCDACRQLGTLHVKFVAHVGEVAKQTIRKHEKLVGVDVIAAHRMLKNSVPRPEYVLVSEPLYESLAPELRERAVRLDQELEGLGTIPAYFVDLGEQPIELPPPPDPGFLARVGATLGVGLRALPSVVGLRPLRSPGGEPPSGRGAANRPEG